MWAVVSPRVPCTEQSTRPEEMRAPKSDLELIIHPNILCKQRCVGQKTNKVTCK